MSKQTYRIKPLEWKRVKNAGGELFSAPAIGGQYEVWRLPRSRRWWWLFDDGDGRWPKSDECLTADKGKAAAEEHWRTTITRFLEEVSRE